MLSIIKLHQTKIGAEVQLRRSNRIEYSCTPTDSKKYICAVDYRTYQLASRYFKYNHAVLN